MEEDKLNKTIDLLKSEIEIYDQYYCLATSQALKIVLNELDRLKKENEKLKEQVNMFDEAYSGAIKESKKWFDIAHDSIPKQVIRNKLKDIELAIAFCENENRFKKLIIKKCVLKELLGE